MSLGLKNVVKRFGGLTATNDMSFDVAPGESLGLIGPNGAGKTTIFSLVMGEHAPNSGSITHDGRELVGLPTHARIATGISRTYQVPRPFAEMTVAENIRVGLTPDRLGAMLFQAPDPAAELDLARSVGFSVEDLTRHPAELSMGDLRKLELARTLATGAKTILLDEVFAGLTTGEIAQITDLINAKRAEGLTLVIVSHDLKALEPLIDRAIAMTQGTKIAEGSFAEVIADPGVRASYLGDAA
ncbi:MAG: ATP-binding cassette domain-containing protein [Pseudomonadota bacterium]